MQRRGKDSAAFTSAVTSASPAAVIIILRMCVCVGGWWGLLKSVVKFGSKWALVRVYVHKLKPVCVGLIFYLCL